MGIPRTEKEMSDIGCEQLSRYIKVMAAKRATAEDSVPCPRCNGKGRLMFVFECNCCSGFGRVDTAQSDKVKAEIAEEEYENNIIADARKRRFL